MRQSAMDSARTWPAWAAFWWGIVFGGLNLYWSLGGRFLSDHLALAIQRDIDAGNASLMLINTIGGFGKIVAGLLALATVMRWGPTIPRRLHLWLLYLGGALLLLYGGANWVQMLLVELDIVDVPFSIGAAQVRWYLFLWEPIWIVGGVLFLMTARLFARSAHR